MSDLNIIDQFMTAFIRYIDSGFGLLGGDVRFLTATLIAIDVTLAALFWTLAGDDNILGRFIRKILFVGAFAYIINSFQTLADIIYRSFAQAGLTAGGGVLTADDLLKPGRLAGTGFSAAWPLLEQAGKLLTVTSFFQNALQITVLLVAWLLVILAFFILAVQMFVCIIEFKLVGLAGFILVPFALWNRTSFLAERVLGHVVSSGIKVMVLAVIVGIGSNFFDQFIAALQGQEPDVGQAMSLVLASLALLGLGIFAPSVASGLGSGAPQLGAGAAVGTVVGAGGAAMLVGGAAIGGARLAGTALGSVRAGSSMGGGASAAEGLGGHGGHPSPGGGGGQGGGSGGAGVAPHTDRTSPPSRSGTSNPPPAHDPNPETQSPQPGEPGGKGDDGPPAWAKALRAEQTARHRQQLAIHTVQQGDRGGSGASPDISERND